MKKTIFMALLMVTVTNVFADSDFFTVTPVKFQINATDAKDKLDDILKYPEGVLKRFKPEGATITNKRVSQNRISFNATKTIMFISKTVMVQGTLDSNENNRGCAANESGYDVKLELDGSDAIVLDNIDRLEIKLCVKDNNNSISGVVKPFIYKGRDYSSTTGSIAKGIIEAQVNPLLKALNDEIASKK